MSDTTFTNGVTLTDADWFNDVNRLHYTIFADAANVAAARTAIGVGTSDTVAFGGLNINGGGALTQLLAGSYTPTLTGVANVTASTASTCRYFRIGNQVWVFGTIAVDPTANATLTSIDISLPIASNFSDDEQLAGSASGESNTAIHAGVLYAQTTTDNARLDFYSSGTDSYPFYFTFGYQII